MLTSSECTILSLDNADKVVKMTGLKLEEVAEIYRRNINMGSVQIYWVRGDRWFTLSIEAKYVNFPNETIDDHILEIMDDHSRLKPSA